MTLALRIEQGEAALAQLPPGMDYPRRRPLLRRGRFRRWRRAGTEAAPVGLASARHPAVEVLVSAGDRVSAGDAVLRSAVSARAAAIDVSGQLGLAAERIPALVTRAVGDMVAEGDAIAERRLLGGLQRRTVRSPITGRVEHVSGDTGTVYIRPLAQERRVTAHLAGSVVEVAGAAVLIEGEALAVGGVAGAGPAVSGVLVVADSPQDLPVDATDTIVACGFAPDAATVQQLIAAGARGLLAAGLEESAVGTLDWDDVLWPHPDQAESRPTPPLTVVLLAWGPAVPPPGVWEALRPLAGQPASLLGAEPGAAAELLVADGGSGLADETGDAGATLAPGQRVRVLAGRAERLIGEVTGLSGGPYRLSSEIFSDSAEIAFPYDVRMRVPLLHLRRVP